MSVTIEWAVHLGTARGLAAASWVFDGNTTQETYSNVLRMLDDGDPEIYDTFGVSWLSGEWAGESLSEIFGDLLTDTDADDEMFAAYEDAADEAYWAEIECVARSQVQS